MMNNLAPKRIAQVMGLIALALILGALGFQYLDNLPPCEMCHWQRWPLIAAAVVGIVGGIIANHRAGIVFAVLTIVLVAISGGIGAYQAGVEWHWWLGPQACTGSNFIYHGTLDLNAPVVRCDVAAFRLFGISLAGYNAIVSLGSALVASFALLRAGKA
ncbi:MAG TPA: disulfide bond formation protein B [Rhizomicrobium sp.]|jgi:disulfide bond formation protein DsbB|nr:disulfide bond formation protein B [Rhizomicrobium sp.]